MADSAPKERAPALVQYAAELPSHPLVAVVAVQYQAMAHTVAGPGITDKQLNKKQSPYRKKLSCKGFLILQTKRTYQNRGGNNYTLLSFMTISLVDIKMRN